MIAENILKFKYYLVPLLPRFRIGEYLEQEDDDGEEGEGRGEEGVVVEELHPVVRAGEPDKQKVCLKIENK